MRRRDVGAHHVEHVGQRLLDLGAGGRPAEGDDLDRQREGAERLHLLRGVGDHDHPVARRGHDLLLQKRAAAALDEERSASNSSAPSMVRSSQPASSSDTTFSPSSRACAAVRGGGDAGQRQPLGADALGQRADHQRGGRAGAEAELHAVLDEVDRAARGGGLGAVAARGGLGHAGAPAGRVWARGIAQAGGAVTGGRGDERQGE
jgi:hypothetical protein